MQNSQGNVGTRFNVHYIANLLLYVSVMYQYKKIENRTEFEVMNVWILVAYFLRTTWLSYIGLLWLTDYNFM